MSRMTCRLAIVSLTVALLAALPAGRAEAQNIGNVSCPCLDSSLLDTWFESLALSPSREKEMFLCVDEPGFLTFDYFDRTDQRRAIYVDVTYATTRTNARCVFEVSDSRINHEAFRTELSQREANVCRTEVLASRIWRDLKCPASRRVLDR